MATTKRTNTKSTRKKPTEDQPATAATRHNSIADSNIKNILKKLKEIKITAKYCVEQLLYLFVILFAAILIQNMWNFLAFSFQKYYCLVLICSIKYCFYFIQLLLERNIQFTYNNVKVVFNKCAHCCLNTYW